MKKDEMLKGLQAGPAGLGEEPVGLGKGKFVRLG